MIVSKFSFNSKSAAFEFLSEQLLLRRFRLCGLANDMRFLLFGTF